MPPPFRGKWDTASAVPINLGQSRPLPDAFLHVPEEPDTLAGSLANDSVIAASLNTHEVIDRPEPVQVYIGDGDDDPAGADLTWTLTATALSTPSGAVPQIIPLFTGVGAVGRSPTALGQLGMLSPSALPDGLYELTLTVTSTVGGSSVSNTDKQLVQIESAVKLGNLTLPVTDLTQNVPGSGSLSVSRHYDSSNSLIDSGLGLGWSLDASQPAVTTTATGQYEGQTAYSYGDLVYVTLPSGMQQVFAFTPVSTGDAGIDGFGAVEGDLSFIPEFSAVDGSNSTLVPTAEPGTVGDEQLYLQEDGTYRTDSLQGYDPAGLGLSYTLTTEDGTSYANDGNRVKETVNDTTTIYLNDKNNPTGYAQPIEEKSSATAAPSMTYVIGPRILAQKPSDQTIAFLVADGHGQTRLLTGVIGIVASAFNFSCFGGAIGFDPSTASTTFLIGDAIYDPASGLYLRGSGRPTDSYRFIQRDPPGYDANDDPATHNLYLLDNADSINGFDPTGHFTMVELGVAITVIGVLAAIAYAAVHAAYSHVNANFAQGTGGPDFTSQLLTIDRYLTTQAAAGKMPPMQSKGTLWQPWDLQQFSGLGNSTYLTRHPSASGVLNSMSGPVMTISIAGKVYRPEQVN